MNAHGRRRWMIPLLYTIALAHLAVGALLPWLADAPLLDEYYIASTYIVTWGTDVPGMQNVVDTMTAAQPDLAVSDVYILGWTEAMVTQAITVSTA